MSEIAFFFIGLGIICGLITIFILNKTKKSKT